MRTVDVVVPCYNYGRFLNRCVGSILSQRDVDVRVLIIDDASSDNSSEVAASLAAQNSRVSVVRHEKNQGLVRTANEGVIDWASAEYTALISADDALMPGSFARATQVMNENPEVGMTYGMALVVADESRMIDGEDVCDAKYRVVSGPEFLRQTCEHGITLSSPTALVRTSIQKLVGGYHPNFPHSCDLEMWMRIATRASIGVLPTKQAYYRWHGLNMSTGFIYRPTSDLQEQLATAMEVCLHWGENVREFPSLVAGMKLRFAKQACWMAGLAFERGDPGAIEDCLGFALKQGFPLWRLKSWWAFHAKRAVGRSLSRRIRGVLHPKEAGDGQHSVQMFAPFKFGETFGWWPEAP
jgi:hypothetical protein